MASITCGNCKGTHSSSAEVKECYGVQADTFQAQRASVLTATVSATPKQVAFIDSLTAERIVPEDTQAAIDRGYDKAKASAIIKRLLECPKKEQPKAEAQPVGKVISACPDGYYAVESATGNNDLDFFVVEHGKKGGKWEHVQFISRVIGGRSDQRIRGTEAAKAIERILAAGPEQAAQRYGQEIGQCGRCNRHLTDEVSRQMGIGPVCRSMAW